MGEKSATEYGHDIPFALEVESSFRKKMGPSLAFSDIFTPEKIKECQVLIERSYDQLFADVQRDLVTVDSHYKKAVADQGNAIPLIQEIARMAFVMKGRLEAIGFSLASEASKSLHEYASSMNIVNNNSLFVVNKHIDVLAVVLKECISGNGGELGTDILDSLNKLCKKFATQ